MKLSGVSIHGGLLGPDIFDLIEQGSLPGQEAKDFSLPGRLPEEISAAWGYAQKLWEAFAPRIESLPEEGNRATTETRSLWLTPLLSLLGYDPLQTPQAITIGSRSFPISHRVDSSENAPPLHAIGCRVSLDHMDTTLARRMSPQAMFKAFLDAEGSAKEPIWGALTNGYLFRLLRTSQGSYRPVYIEFDLKDIMSNGRYREFSLFYRLCHRTRLAQASGRCLLEEYRKKGIEGGSRVRGEMRKGVESALKQLGAGFLTHPANESLRGRIAGGDLSEMDYYRQILMMIYRFLFLLVIEDRDMVLPPDTLDRERRQKIYRRYYSISRLRALAENISGSADHSDLWISLQTAFKRLFAYNTEIRANTLGVPVINGHLFGNEVTPDLDTALLSNDALLKAMRSLTLFNDGSGLRRVDFEALDVEEFGSVYESLLELRPHIASDVRGSFTFSFVAGSERRSTGSYYTPTEIVHQLIDHALVPVLQEKLEQAEDNREAKEKALLSLTVLDPACGSGHFLLAASRHLGRELSQIRTEEQEPTPIEFQRAVRDVIQHCIYGVDKNPLAVDLCKLALWIEGHNVGKPVSLLDHHIKCGDSLVGITDLAQIKHIPDGASTATTGDDKSVMKEIKKRQKEWAKGTLGLFRDDVAIDEFVAADRLMDETPEETAVQEIEKQRFYEGVRGEGTSWRRDLRAADMWASAFFWPLKEGGLLPPTDADIYSCLQDRANARQIESVRSIAQEQRFFHWPLEFPAVMAVGGFDAILGNPPFLGGLKISTEFGERYLKRWLTSEFPGSGGTMDLVAYFMRRAFGLLKQNGHIGMVTTNTIAQGDTRERGLGHVVDSGGTIVFAVPSTKWIGDANLEVALLGIRRGPWEGLFDLNGRQVNKITEFLDDGSFGEGFPVRLQMNAGKAFIGSYVLGQGYVLTPSEANALLSKNPVNKQCLFPYLTGEDINSRPDHSPSRWVVNFFDWPLERAEEFPDLLERIRRTVKHVREKNNRVNYREHWWIHAENRPGLYEAIGALTEILISPRVSHHHVVVRHAASIICSEQAVVFAMNSHWEFATLQSTLHELWARKHSSTLETRLRYAPSDCFQTFPLPGSTVSLEQLGDLYYRHRESILHSRTIGLTKTYNLFHDSACNDADIVRLRSLRREMDRAVADAYGWSDLDLGHDFHEDRNTRTARYTLSPEAQTEVLKRLLLLNHQRAREEQDQAGD